MNTKLDKITFILREKKDAQRNSKYLNDKGIFSKPFPITALKYENYLKSNIYNCKFDYFIITSPKAIKVLDKIILKNDVELSNTFKVFTIGLETKEKLKKSGYKSILNANSNSKSLYQLIINSTNRKDYGLWVAAKDRSVDLKEMLKQKNRKIEILEAYSTEPIIKLSKSIQDDLVNYGSYNLLILSSRNVLITKQILEKYNLFTQVNQKATLLVNSSNVAEKAQEIGWSNIKIIKKNFTKDILDNILQLTK